jgi:hypothetical protein
MATTTMVETNSPASQLEQKIRTRTATVGVVGLGYVGLPLLRAFFQAGFSVVGYDVDQQKIDMLHRGESYLKHLGEDFVQELSKSPKFVASADPSSLAKADAIILCVPTPLGRHGEPDMSYIVKSTEMVAKVLRKGQLISLESTTYPGTTRGDCLPILAKTGLVAGQDYFMAFSPEREDPGRKDHSTQTIPKLVGGIDEVSGKLATMLYAAAIKQVIPVSKRGDRRSRQAAREHLPLREHRARERAEARARGDGHRHLEGDRRGEDQAVRLPGRSTRAPASAGTASRSTRSTSRGRRASTATTRASSSSPARSTTRCRTT